MMELRTDRYKLKEIFPDKVANFAKRLKVKAGDLEYVRKGIPIDPQTIEIKEGERAAIRLVTTPHLDRDSEILIPSGAILDDFRQSPTVMYAHDYRSLPIGSDQWIKHVKEGILAKTVYAKHQFAEDVFQCVKDRHLNANSVGFIPVEAVESDDAKPFGQAQETLEKDYGIARDESAKAKRIYTKWILLEHSDVPIPSNAQSLNLAVSKGELVIESERLRRDLELEIVRDGEIEMRDEKTGELFAVSGSKVLKEIGNIIAKPETTENYHRIPVEDAGNHEGHRIRTITISAEQGIKALYCGECKVVITYLFDVDKWTMAEAQAWVREHKEFIDGLSAALRGFFTEGIIPEQEYRQVVRRVVDELGWLPKVPEDETIDKEHGNPNLEAAIKELTDQVAELKEGRILNAENRALVKDTIDALVLLREKLDELYEAGGTPVTGVDKPKGREIVIERNGKPNLDENIAAAVDRLIKNGQLGRIVDEAMRNAFDVGLKRKLGKVE